MTKKEAKYFASYIMVRAFTQFFLHTQNKEKLVQDAKDLLTPEGVEQVKEIYNKK